MSAERRWVVAGMALAVVLALGVWADRRRSWVGPAFGAVAHLFYEVPVLATLRRPSQLVLIRAHLAVLMGLVAFGCLAAPWLDRHGRRCWAVFVLGDVVRAVVWIAGGNLPLVPGDSCHYPVVSRNFE